MDKKKIAEAEKHFYLDVLSWTFGYLINLALILIGAYVAFRYMRSLEESDYGRGKQDNILSVRARCLIDSSSLLGRKSEDSGNDFQGCEHIGLDGNGSGQ